MPETKRLYEIMIEDQTADFRAFAKARLVRESSVVGIEPDTKNQERCYAYLSGGTVWRVLMSAEALAALLGFEIVRSTPTQ